MIYMKKRIFAILIVLALSLTLAVGCSQNQQQQSTSEAQQSAGEAQQPAGEAQQPAGEATVPEEQILIRFNSWSGSEGDWGYIQRFPLREVERLSNNRVKFEEYFYGTLIPAGEEIAVVGSGAVELACVYLPNVSARLPLMSVVLNPGFLLDPRSFSKAWGELSLMQEIQDEFTQNNLKLLSVFGVNSEHIFSNKPINKLADFSGLRIRALGDSAQVLGDLGASVAGLASADVFEALERGTIDATFTSIAGAEIWKVHEVSKYFIPLDATPMGPFWMMNLDFFNSLPEDIQAIITDVFSNDNMIALYFDEYADIRDETFFNITLDEFSVEMTELPKEEKDGFFDVGAAISANWASDQESKGLPGNKVYSEWGRLVEKYK